MMSSSRGFLGCLVAAAALVGVSGHGYVKSPVSRAYGCSSGGGRLNQNCGQVQWEPQSVEGPDGWPSGGPAAGKVASAGKAAFSALEAQSSMRWAKVPISAGNTPFTWQFRAQHVTRDFRYYITREGWNVNRPLDASSFEATPFCTVDFGMQKPPMELTHDCTVPTREGYHVVLAVWDVGDTAASFYNVIDVVFQGGSQPQPQPQPTSAPQTTPVPMPVPVPVPTTTSTPVPVPVPSPVPVTPPSTPVPAVVTPPASGLSKSDSRLVAFIGNWQACPTDAQLREYTHIMISFAVTYTYNAAKNKCDTQCRIGTPVPVCENQPQPALVRKWRAAGKKVIVSFGGAGMGGSWAGDVNDCWEHCFGKEAEVVSQLQTIVASQEFDGVDIDYEYFHEDSATFKHGAAAQRFLRDVTVGLKQQLPAGSLVTHAPMDPDLKPGRGYYSVMQEVAGSVDFVLPQYYNGVTRPNVDGLHGGTHESAGAHLTNLVDNMFGGDATRVVFGFCINDCSGTGSNADASAAVRVMRELRAEHPCNGGAFFWVVKDDVGGAWSGEVAKVLKDTRGCSASTQPQTPAPAPVLVPVPVPTAQATPSPASSPAPAPVSQPPTSSGCQEQIPAWGPCLGKESCCRAGLQCTGNKWWMSCKP